MRVLILGAGAVGGYIGARLIASGADVVFLARGRRLETLSADGLVVKSPLGDFTGKVEAANAPPAGFRPDVLIVACKAPALQDAVRTIAPALAPETRLLPLLNGVVHLEALQSHFASTALLGGLTHGAVTLRDDGVIDHLTPFFTMVFGPVSGEADPVAERFGAELTKTGLDVTLSDNIRQAMWEKFVFLATLAGSTCLMRASVGTIMAAENGEDVILELLAENLAVARAEGFEPEAAAMASYKRVLTERGSTLTSSMLRDVLSGRRTEANHILGDMLRRARRHGLGAPLLTIANAHLQCHEATLS